jgi:putative ABC transport system ATP-binding protein
MSGQKVIELVKVNKVYDMGAEVQVNALKDISLTIEKGEYVAIMGPSGSGKTTLMNIVGCLDTPTSGLYLFDGVNVSDMDDNELAKIRNQGIGFVFQTFNLIPRSDALHNVELPLIYSGVPVSERKERARKTLEMVGLGERIHHKPNELSGGQRQRVAIARALINNPAIILADEPTGNLDSKTGDEIMLFLEDLHTKGNTIILVTHEEYIAEHAKRIIRIRDGMIESDLPIQKNGKVKVHHDAETASAGTGGQG